MQTSNNTDWCGVGKLDEPAPILLEKNPLIDLDEDDEIHLVQNEDN